MNGQTKGEGARANGPASEKKDTGADQNVKTGSVKTLALH